MNKNSTAVALVVVVLALIAIFTLMGRTASDVEPTPAAATSTTPGTATGGAGPVAGSPATVVASLGQTADVLGGFSITPTTVLEDSRCPKDVQCIQAGTVRVNARVASAGGTFSVGYTLGTPASTVGGWTVTLVDVQPGTIAGVKIADASYRFTFSVEKK